MSNMLEKQEAFEKSLEQLIDWYKGFREANQPLKLTEMREKIEAAKGGAKSLRKALMQLDTNAFFHIWGSGCLWYRKGAYDFDWYDPDGKGEGIKSLVQFENACLAAVKSLERGRGENDPHPEEIFIARVEDEYERVFGKRGTLTVDGYYISSVWGAMEEIGAHIGPSAVLQRIRAFRKS